MPKPGELPGAWERRPAVAGGPGRWTSPPSGPGFLGRCRFLGEAEGENRKWRGFAPKRAGVKARVQVSRETRAHGPHMGRQLGSVAQREHLHGDTHTQKAQGRTHCAPVHQKRQSAHRKLPEKETRLMQSSSRTVDRLRNKQTGHPRTLAPRHPSRHAPALALAPSFGVRPPDGVRWG